MFVFFDIGNTLGRVDATGQFSAFISSRPLLQAMRDTLGLRIGVITNLPIGMDRSQAQSLLEGAGLGEFLDPNGLITNHEAGADKPNPAVYQFAAVRVGVPIARCLYVGEDDDEVRGAHDAGMRVIRKPVPQN
jgi:FMN phosphatase YigB (HAD superfamily)